MFIEKIDVNESKKMLTNYMAHIIGVDRAKEWASRGEMLQMPDATQLNISEGVYFQNGAIMMTDFEVVATFAISPVEKYITNQHRHYMYRKFGKEYLDALDRNYREPIEQEYREQMEEHNNMLKEVAQEKEI